MRRGNATGFAGPSGISSALSDYVQDFFSFLLKGEQRGMRESPFLLVFTNPSLQATRVPFSQSCMEPMNAFGSCVSCERPTVSETERLIERGSGHTLTWESCGHTKGFETNCKSRLISFS